MTHSTVPLRSNFSAASLEHFLYFNKAYTTAWKCIKFQNCIKFGFLFIYFFFLFVEVLSALNV